MLFFTWIIFVEQNFTVLFLLLRNDRFAGKVGEWVTSRNGGILAMGGGVELRPLYGLCTIFNELFWVCLFFHIFFHNMHCEKLLKNELNYWNKFKITKSVQILLVIWYMLTLSSYSEVIEKKICGCVKEFSNKYTFSQENVE